MSYLGGLNDDERSMYQSMIHRFALALQEERQRAADLTRQLECERERIALLEAAGYGII
jgi:hypothetical protein